MDEQEPRLVEIETWKDLLAEELLNRAARVSLDAKVAEAPDAWRSRFESFVDAKRGSNNDCSVLVAEDDVQV